MCSYYATLKADNRYRKRVTWLVSNSDVTAYEYQGMPSSVNAGHGTATQGGERFREIKARGAAEDSHKSQGEVCTTKTSVLTTDAGQRVE